MLYLVWLNAPRELGVLSTLAANNRLTQVSLTLARLHAGLRLASLRLHSPDKWQLENVSFRLWFLTESRLQELLITDATYSHQISAWFLWPASIVFPRNLVMKTHAHL